jgi:hypothetical protein
MRQDYGTPGISAFCLATRLGYGLELTDLEIAVALPRRLHRLAPPPPRRINGFDH